MTNIDEFSKTLLETIATKDAGKSLALIQQFKEHINTDASYIMWLTAPVNLTLVQSSLTEHFGIPQKAMMIKPRPGVSRGLRASYFLQAMENSLKRVI